MTYKCSARTFDVIAGNFITAYVFITGERRHFDCGRKFFRAFPAYLKQIYDVAVQVVYRFNVNWLFSKEKTAAAEIRLAKDFMRRKVFYNPFRYFPFTARVFHYLVISHIIQTNLISFVPSSLSARQTTHMQAHCFYIFQNYRF